jgi:thioredoxin-dependent peroxiredoxin
MFFNQYKFKDILMRVSVGQNAIAFEEKDIFGNTVSFNSSLNSKVMLSFFRYASCPLCNLRINHLIRHYEKLSRAGLKVIAVFQSPVESITQYVGKQDAPFPIIADPEQNLYKRYGVTGSMLGMLRTSFRVKELSQSFGMGYLPGKIEGTFAMIPADFLINNEFVVERAFYGKDIGDHLPFEEVYTWLGIKGE